MISTGHKQKELKKFPPPISVGSLDPKRKKFPFIVAGMLLLNGIAASILYSEGGHGFLGLFAATCFVLIYISLLTGLLPLLGGKVTRASEPFLFWPMLIVLGIAGIWLTLAPWFFQ